MLTIIGDKTFRFNVIDLISDHGRIVGYKCFKITSSWRVPNSVSKITFLPPLEVIRAYDIQLETLGSIGQRGRCRRSVLISS